VDAYLASSTWIHHEHPEVAALAARLRAGTPEETARRCFTWVRDEVRHSADLRANPVTCARPTSSSIARGSYAKAHLLAALLRANGHRAGLAYQRLSLNGGGAPFSLHGLVAVELPGVGWFTPPVERLAFAPREPGERDLKGIHAGPRPEVVACLTRHATWDAVYADLPDQG
jgi:transglutaminase-like putative cysteine protease